MTNADMKFYVNVDEEGNLVTQKIFSALDVAKFTEQDYGELVIPKEFELFVFKEAPKNLTKYQEVIYSSPYKDDAGNWTRDIDIVDIEAGSRKIKIIDGPVTERQKKIRDEKLVESDWTQLADSPLTDEKKSEWAEYRKKLRDITDNPGFPVHHKWPLPPK